jgi:hypothetical protein
MDLHYKTPRVCCLKHPSPSNPFIFVKMNIADASLPFEDFMDLSAELTAMTDRMRSGVPLEAFYHDFNRILDVWGPCACDLILVDQSFQSLLQVCLSMESPPLKDLLLFINRLCNSLQLSPPDSAIDCLIRFLLLVIDYFPHDTSLMELACLSLLILSNVSSSLIADAILQVLEVVALHNGFDFNNKTQLFSVADGAPEAAECQRLAITVVQLFELYLESSRDQGHANIVFDHLWCLSASCCYELCLSSVSALIHAAHRPGFLSRLRTSKAIGPLAERLVVFREFECGKGAEQVLLLFTEIACLNRETDNLWLMIQAPTLVPSLLGLTEWNPEVFYAGSCRIMANLVVSLGGFAKNETVRQVVDGLLRGNPVCLGVQSKLFAGILFAQCVLRVRRRQLPGFLEYRFIIDCFPDLLEIARDQELSVFLSGLLRFLSNKVVRQQLGQFEELATVLENLNDQVSGMESITRILELLRS